MVKRMVRMLDYLRAMWRRHVIDNVPPALDACEACRRTDCMQDEWSRCPQRLIVARTVPTRGSDDRDPIP